MRLFVIKQICVQRYELFCIYARFFDKKNNRTLVAKKLMVYFYRSKYIFSVARVTAV